MNNEDMLSLINSIPVVEVSASCGEIDYILAEDNEETRDILSKVLNEVWERDNCIAEDGMIDISYAGFKYSNYFSKKTGFINKEEQDNE